MNLRNLSTYVLLVASTCLLAGCATEMQRAEQKALEQRLNTPVEVRVTTPPFDEIQAKNAMALGNNRIKGVLYHKIRNGGREAGRDGGPLNFSAGTPLSNVTVLLYPSTEHLREVLRLEQENRGERRYGKAQLKRFFPDPRIYKYGLQTQTDNNGLFHFNELRPGKYYVMALNQNIHSNGNETVVTGISHETVYVMSAFGPMPISNPVVHKQNRNFNVVTEVEYSEFIEIPPGKNEVTVEARMRPVR